MQKSHKSVFYDAQETEPPIPEGIPPAPAPSGPKVISKHEPDYDQLRPFLGWISPEIIKKTFKHTAQYASLPAGTLLKKVYKYPNPALNVFRRQEDVACDIVYSDVPDIYDGSTAAVILTAVSQLSATRSQKLFVLSVLTTGRVNHINRTRILLKDDTRPSRILLTAFLTALEHHSPSSPINQPQWCYCRHKCTT
jgi:hypothetical protein